MDSRVERITTSRLTAAATMILPALIALGFIHVFGVNAFFWDRWAMVDLIAGVHTGDFHLPDAFRQHTNHRPFFSRLAILGLGLLTDFNARLEMAFSWSLHVGTTLLLFGLFWRDRVDAGLDAGERLPESRTMFLFAPAVWLLFTLRQWENFLWGWQIQVFLTVFGVALAITMLETSEGLDRRFILALAGAVLASFSYMPGLGVWFVGLFYFLIAGEHSRRRYAAWILSGLAAFALFFADWSRPPSRGSLMFAFQHPVDSAHFFVLATAAPVADTVVAASAAGVGVLLLYATVAVIGVTDDCRRTAKWLSLLAFAVGSCLMFTLGRVFLGNQAALISRYTTLSVLGLVGSYLIILQLDSRNVRTFLSGAISVFIVVAVVMGAANAAVMAPQKEATRELSACALLEYDELSNEELSHIYHTPTKVRTHALVLERHNLSAFATPDAYNCGGRQLVYRNSTS